jgi:hypothetical protein
MYLDMLAGPQDPLSPTKNDVDAQLILLKKKALRNRKRQFHLLEFILRRLAGEGVSLPEPEAFYSDFYKHEHEKWSTEIHDKPYSTGRQLFRDLRINIENYYKEHGLHDPVLIEFINGRGETPCASISWNPRRPSTSMPTEQEPPIALAQVNASGRNSSDRESHSQINSGDWKQDLDGNPKPAKVLLTGEWSHTDIEGLLTGFSRELALKRKNDSRSASPSHNEVRIWANFFTYSPDMVERIEAIVRDGVAVKILIMNPKNFKLLRSKYRLRGISYSPGAAREKLNDQIHIFEEKKSRLNREGAKGSLMIEPCDSMPFGTFCQIGDRVMLVGHTLPLQTSLKGPLIKLYPGTAQWDIFNENWESCWNNPRD